MGYFTNYYLNVENEQDFSKEDIVSAAKSLAKITDIIDEKYVDGPYPFSFLCEYALKWYDFDNDMLKLSQLYPQMKFVLYGEGETRDDNWFAYYYKGKGAICEGHITYDPAPEWFKG